MKNTNKIALFLIASLFPVLLIYSQNASGQKENITLDDIWGTYRFYPKGIDDLKSMKDGENYTQLKDNKIEKYSYKTGKLEEVVFDPDKYIPEGKKQSINIGDYFFCDDESKLLISCDEVPLYRYSSVSTNYIFDIKNKKLIPIAAGKKQQLSEFSPDGKKVAFVRDNNLFIFDIEAGKEEQVTRDGEKNAIINGSSDWVYEEEFDFSKCYYWSPDSRKIAFIRFDESKVKEFSMVKYGELYPEVTKFKYPKAGEDNSILTVLVYDLEMEKITNMDIGKETNIYIPRIKWTETKDILCITCLNRLQNKLELLLDDVNTGSSKVLFTESNKYFIDITDNLTFLKKQKGFIWTSDSTGYNEIYLYDMNGKLIRQITKGKFDITEINAIDEKNSIIYYTAPKISTVMKQVYSVHFDGTGDKLISPPAGTTDIKFSNTFKYCVVSWSDANTPRQITINDAGGKKIRSLEDNKELTDKLSNFNISKKTFFHFTTTENIELNGWMIKPPGFDSTKKYPVLMYVYGGPGANTVFDAWDYHDLWHQLLAEKGYIIVSVDNRGTSGRGEEFKKCTYMQLGKLETIDQIETAKFLGKLKYVDPARIGIWGWSYGGYMSLSCIFKGADVFKMAIAVAPVTNWRYYDNIYTERYMRTPQENPDGYDKNSPINFVNELKGKLLVIHGTYDDNVHFQNTAELVKALNDADKQFDIHIYTNKNHNISGGKTRLHLYTKMTDYILNNL